MKVLFALALFSLALLQTEVFAQTPSGLEVVQFDYKVKNVEVDRLSTRLVSERPPTIKPDPSANRGRDVNEKEFVTIRNETTQHMNDLRSLSDMRSETPYAPVKRPAWDAKAEIRNNYSKSVTRFVWTYHRPQPSPDLQDALDQEYLCRVSIEPGETKRARVLARIPHSLVVSASSSGVPPAQLKPSLKDMVINRVEFSDGTTWQRANWNPIVLSRQGAQKLGKGKCIAL
jgi:hypothetical protein